MIKQNGKRNNEGFALAAKGNSKKMKDKRIRESPNESSEGVVEEIAKMNLPVSDWKKMKKEIESLREVSGF
ncbi:MAG: hypothetical protein AABY04_03000 [Candidatus Micrarchaeota archaeon]